MLTCASAAALRPSAGMLRALLGRQLLRARGPPAVREPFPRAARVVVRHVWPPGDRPLRVRPGPPLPPGPLHLHLLPAPAHQGLLPGARGQALLPALLCQALRLSTCGAGPCGRPRPQGPRPSPRHPKALLLELGGLSSAHPVKPQPPERPTPKVLLNSPWPNSEKVWPISRPPAWLLRCGAPLPEVFTLFPPLGSPGRRRALALRLTRGPPGQSCSLLPHYSVHFFFYLYKITCHIMLVRCL